MRSPDTVKDGTARDFDEISIDPDRIDVLGSSVPLRAWPVTIRTPAEPWSYAAYLPIPPRVRRSRNARLRIHAKSVKGEPWVGVLTRDQKDFLCRSAFSATDAAQEILFDDIDLRSASAIVVENGATAGESRVTIERASILVPASAWTNPLPPRTGAASKRIQLGRYAFMVDGVSADDVYFKSLRNDFEPEFQAFCQQFVDDDAVCLDIGANIGLKTLFLARHASKGRVVAVEAAPGVAACLQRNVAANSASNVECVQVAIGDRVGSARFNESSAYGHLAGEGVEVPMLTLEELVRRSSLPRVDFIKIDVEGFEFPILQSACNFINAQRALVLFEFNSWCQLAFANVNPKTFLEWIFEHFAYVGILRQSPRGYDLVEQVRPDQLLYVLHDNLVTSGCVSDFVVTNALERL